MGVQAAQRSPAISRAVIYARYSSDLQRAASIEDQVRLCSARIKREGWTLTKVFSDSAVSGSSDRRPDYQAMLAGARDAAFDVIVSESLDRLSRDQEHVASVYKTCKFARVKIVTISEGEISPLHVGLSGTMGAMFIEKLANMTHRGQHGRVEKGFASGGVSYGYAVAPRIDEDGKVVAGVRRIVEPEAAVIRRILHDYADGLSPRTIAAALNQEGVKSPRDKNWAASTINGNRRRGTGILNNELYVGILVWNRQNYGKNPATGNRVSRHNAEEEIVRTEVPKLRIVDDELWQCVRERQGKLDEQAEASGGSPSAKQRPRSIFSGLMRCGVCGSGFSKISAMHFGCSGARNKGEAVCVNRATIRCDKLERTVLDGLRNRLMDPAVYKTFAEAFVSEWNRQIAAVSGEGAKVRSELNRISSQIERLIDAVADGDVTGASIRARLEALEKRKAELAAELSTPAPTRPRLHPNLAEVYRQEIVSLADALDAEDAIGARDMVRGLIDSITINAPEPEGDAGRRVELRGKLAAMLALGRGVSGVLAVQMEMVAGTGFEPVTFRL